MPNFLISVVNAEFAVEDEEEHPDVSTAAEQAIKGALAVGTEHVLAGKGFFGAEVSVGDGNGRQRFMVSVGVSPLKN